MFLQAMQEEESISESSSDIDIILEDSPERDREIEKK